ncbi:hypothetical protein [Streptomyces sp. NPDC052701]|uniref:hypothetical protein n=1 Tax=Streptomyces sp. NPDC052701 TaxID=3155533 RepID=UPI00341AA437
MRAGSRFLEPALKRLLLPAAFEMFRIGAFGFQAVGAAAAVAETGQVSGQRAYPVRITIRRSPGRLRTMRRRGEAYAGQWLPGPPLTTPDAAGNADQPVFRATPP